ncbi:MAG TPA: helix-turn-helix domain-containing protein, partial [Candidatus Krumholzibacterium sp.]|nr:helix-turn-helix domain-containing protein [Candidatus Krumholzibacterium sp.]
MTDDEKKKDEVVGNETEPVSSQLDIKSERTVGELLLAAREKAGLSLEAVSLETKIPRKSLEYLETDNFEALPAKVYVRGFLRTYASALGLDYSQILGKFELQTGQTHTSRGDLWEVEEAVVEEEVVSPRLFRKFVLPVLLAIIVVIALIWVISRTGGDEATPPRDVPGEVDPGGGGGTGGEETVGEEENGTGGAAEGSSGGESAEMDDRGSEPGVPEASA